MNREGTVRLLVDFDGTITSQDSELFVARGVLNAQGLERLAQLVAAYESLEIGIADYYEGYFALTPLPRDAWSDLARRVPIRKEFAAFVSACRERSFEVMILSEGLDLFIDPLLGQLGVDELPRSCNRVLWDGAQPRVLPAHDAVSCGRCLNCKGSHARRFLSRGDRVAVVGNGASDLCAAREADFVFARDHLARLCDKEGIAYRSWERFSDIDLRLLEA